jgi:putative peptide zinc metalloprotease protein
MRKLPITTVPYLLQIRPAAKYGLLAYSIVVNLFMGFYFFYLIPNFLYRFICTFPDAVNELILYLSNGMAPPFALLRNIGSQLLFLALVGYLFWKLVQPLVKRYVKQ